MAEAFFCSTILPAWGEPFYPPSHLRPSVSDGSNRKDLIQDLRDAEADTDEAWDGGRKSEVARDGSDRISEWPSLRGHLKLFEITRDPEIKIAELGAIQEGLSRHPSVPRDEVIERLLKAYPNAKEAALQSHILSVLIHLGIQNLKVQQLFEKELRDKAAHQDYTAHLLLQEALMAFAGTVSRGETTAVSPERIRFIKQLLSHPDEEVSYAALYVLVSAFRGAPGRGPILTASEVNQDPAFIERLQHLVTSRNISTAYLSGELMERMGVSSQIQNPAIGLYVEWLEKHALQKSEINPELSEEELGTFFALIQEGERNSPREYIGDLFRSGKKVLFVSDVSHSGHPLPFLAEDILLLQEEVELNRVALPFPESEEENLQKFVRGEISLGEWEYGKRSFLREEGDPEGLAYAASFRQLMRKLNGKVRFIFYGKGLEEEGEFAVMTQLKPIQDALRELAQPRILVLGIPLMGAQLARRHLKTHHDWVTLSIAQELGEEIGEEEIASLLQADEEKWFWDHYGEVHNLVEVIERFPVTESFAVDIQGPHGRLQFSRVYQQPFLDAWDGILFWKTGSHYTVSGKETVWHKQKLGVGSSGVKSIVLVFGGVAWIEAGNHVYRLWADEKSAYLQRHRRPRYTPRGDVHPVPFNRPFTVGRRSPDYALNDPYLAELHFTIFVVRDVRGRLGLAIEDKGSPNGTKIAWREIQEARDGGMDRRDFLKLIGGAGAAAVIGAWGIPRAIDYLKTLGLSPTPEQFLMRLDEVDERLAQTSVEPERARLFLSEIFPLFLAGANYTAHRMKFGAPEGEEIDFITPELRAKLLNLSNKVHPILSEGMVKLFDIRNELLKVEEWHGNPSTRHEGALEVVRKMNRGYLMKQGFYVDFTLTRFREVPWGAWMAYPAEITPWGKATVGAQKTVEIYDFVPLDPNTPILLLAMTDGETVLLAPRNIRDHVFNRMIPVMQGKTVRRYYGLPEKFVSGIGKLYLNDFSSLLSKKGAGEMIHTAVREDVVLHELIHVILEDFIDSSPEVEGHDSPYVEVPVYLTQLATSAIPHTVFATLADFIVYGDQAGPEALNALEVILTAFVEKGRNKGLVEKAIARKWLYFLESPDWASSEGHDMLHFLAGIEKSTLQDMAGEILNERYGKDLAGRILKGASQIQISVADGGWREERIWEDAVNWYVGPLNVPFLSEPFGGKMWIRRGKFLHHFEVTGELVSYVQIEEVRVGGETRNIERTTAYFDVGKAASFDLDSGNFKTADDFLPRYPLALVVERDVRGALRFVVEDKTMKRGTLIAWNKPKEAADGGTKAVVTERAERLRSDLLGEIQKILRKKSPEMSAETVRLEAEKIYEAGLDLVKWDEVLRQLEQELVKHPETLTRAKFILREWVKAENRNWINDRHKPILSLKKDLLLKDLSTERLNTRSVVVFSKSLLGQPPIEDADLLNLFRTHPAFQDIIFLPTDESHLRGIFETRTIHPRDYAVKMRKELGVPQPRFVFFVDERDYANLSNHAVGSIYGPEYQHYADFVYIKAEQPDIIAMLRLGQILLSDDVALRPQKLSDTEKILLQILTGLSPSALSLPDMNSEFDYIHKVLVDILLPQL